MLLWSECRQSEKHRRERQVCAVERTAETVQLALPLRAGLHHALRLRAAEEGTTMRALF